MMPIFAGAISQRILHSYALFEELIFLLDPADVGGKCDPNDEICAICGTTQICMPYRSSPIGLKKFIHDDPEISFENQSDNCHHVFCYYCISIHINHE